MSRISRFVLAAILAGLLGLGTSQAAAGPEILVFAAASLTESIQEAARGFEAQGGPAVRFSFGSSTDLARQIRTGAPADVFFSADAAKMDDLEKAGLVRKGDRRDFLSNRLAVVVPAAATSAPKTAADLVAMPRIVLADPASVPAGIYTKKWLESLGLWQQVESKVVPTLDVRAALAAVETEAAPAAVVYTTDAAISKKVRVAFVVENGPEITYSVAPLAASKNPAAAAFVAYLGGPAGKAVFEKRGFLIRGGGP
jgi:molybdate transport system substrate-binding protein